MIDEDALRSYLRTKFGDVSRVSIRKLGSGVQGSGFLVELMMPGGPKSYVLKSLLPEGLGHDYPSDRAGVFLLDLDEYGNLPAHVKALDVLAEREDGSIFPIGGGKEYYLLMEEGKGADYFDDLRRFSGKERLEARDTARIKSLAAYLAEIHSIKKASRALYWRKIRDTVGHGECLMGVFDTYPDGTLSYEEMASTEKKAADWRARLKPKYARLSMIHGDFHPGNIRFGDGTDFILLDRSRGPWGEPADDITALTINYIFFSIRHYGSVKGPYLDALLLFYDDYVKRSGDEEIYSVVQLFYAFRGIVVANPAFYPDLTPEQRSALLRFVENVLASELFDPALVNEYLS